MHWPERRERGRHADRETDKHANRKTHAKTKHTTHKQGTRENKRKKDRKKDGGWNKNKTSNTTKQQQIKRLTANNHTRHGPARAQDPAAGPWPYLPPDKYVTGLFPSEVIIVLQYYFVCIPNNHPEIISGEEGEEGTHVHTHTHTHTHTHSIGLGLNVTKLTR